VAKQRRDWPLPYPLTNLTYLPTLRIGSYENIENESVVSRKIDRGLRAICEVVNVRTFSLATYGIPI
jgi:hypothetical protein